MLTVVVKKPGEDPEVKLIDGSVEDIQAAVEGYFEAHRFLGGLTLYCNDGSANKYMPPNVIDECHQAVLVGPVLVMRGDYGLSDDDARFALDALKARAVMASAR